MEELTIAITKLTLILAN